MVSFRRNVFALFLIVCLILPTAVVLGEENYYPFPKEGLGIYLPDSWKVITKSNMASQASLIEELNTTASELESGFNQQNILAFAFSDQGTQFILKSFSAPESWSFLSFQKGEQKQDELFEQWLNEKYGLFQEGNWIGESVLVLQVADPSAPLVTHVYATFLGENIFLWEVPVFDRAFSSKEEDEVLLALEGLLYLGENKVDTIAEHTPVPAATLPPAVAGTSPDPAQIKVTRNNTPLTVDYIPSIWESSSYLVNGTTEPLAEMRYYIEGTGYQRFTADDKGNFSVEISSLADGKSTISLQTIGKNGYGNISFTVTVQRVITPLAVTTIQAQIPYSNYTITGATLPNALVEVQGKQKTYNAYADDNGNFTVEVYMPRMGDNAFTLSSMGSGYKKHSQDIMLHRIEGEEEAVESFRDKVITPNYEKAIEKPDSYKDKNFELTGTIEQLYSNKDGLGFVLKEEGTENVFYIATDSLVHLLPQTQVTLLATLTGEILDHSPVEGVTVPVPCATLFRTLPPQG